MKNVLLIGLSMLFSQTLLLAYDAEINGIYYNFSGTDATVTNAPTDNSYSGDVVVPESVIYNGVTYYVTSIGSSAFSGCTGLTSVVIPNSVTSIAEAAFWGCSSLESMSLPFVGNKPHTASSTFQYPFGYIFGSGYSGGISTTQNYYTYSGNTSGTYYIPSILKSVKITGSSYIQSGAFQNCTGLTNIELPNSVTSIGEGAFNGCSSLESITLPFVGDKPHAPSDTYQYPFGYIFGNKYQGTKQEYYGSSTSSTTSGTYDIPSSLKFVEITGSSYIPSYAFNNCESLTNIKIPNSVTNIGERAFAGTGLKSFEVPNSVTSIGEGAFRGCPLESITLPFVGDKPHTSSDLYQYPFGFIFGKLITGFAGTIQYYYGSSTSSTTHDKYNIPYSLKSVKITGSSYIPYGAFYNCAGLSNIELPNSVTSIGGCAFFGCSGVTSFVVPNQVASIGSDAFRDCTGLTCVELSNSATTSIGDSAFYNCSGKLIINSDIDNFLSSEEGGFCGAKFSEIVIGDNVTKICKFAFADMVDLRKVTLGKSVNRVLTKAFAGCIHLTELYCQPTTPPACVTTVFDEDTYLDCTLYVPEESLEQYKAANVWKNFYDFGVNPDVTPVHKLIYQIDGNIYRTEMVEEGATIVAIEAPVREGYTFVGWSGMPDNMIMPDHDLTVVGTYAAPVTETALTIVDGDALDFSLSHTYENLSYTRTFSNTHWQALYVPFSIPVDSLSKYGLQVAELNDTHQWDFNGDGVADSTRVEFFTLTSGSTEANYPYLIRSTEPTTLSLTLKDIEVKAAEENSIECSSTKQKFTFVGTYTGVSGAHMYNNNYYGMSGGGLKRVSNNTVSLKPQRWYMKIENKNGSPVNYFAPSIRFTVDGIDEEEEETSAIVDMCTESRNRHKAFYSLEGIRQHTAPTQRGMYVRQDKKLIIR